MQPLNKYSFSSSSYITAGLVQQTKTFYYTFHEMRQYFQTSVPLSKTVISLEGCTSELSPLQHSGRVIVMKVLLC